MIKRATCKTWAEYFESHEGVKIAENSIRNKLKEAKKIGEDGRGRLGQLFKRAYFSEQDVREACGMLLNPKIPRCGEDGFVAIGGIRYGTIIAFSELLEVSNSYLNACCIKGAEGKLLGIDRSGHLAELWPEDGVFEVVQHLLGKIPTADDEGLLVVRGMLYGTCFSLGRLLGISEPTISKQFTNSGIAPIYGKLKGGQVHKFYPESSARELCARLTAEMPTEDASGYLTVNGIRFGTVAAIGRAVGISGPTVKTRINKWKVSFVSGKDRGGRIQDYYRETEVFRAIEGLTHPMPKAEKTNFLFSDGILHGTISAWARQFGVDRYSILTRIRKGAMSSIKGKTIMGRVRDFYPEPAVREACKDLLAKRKK